MGVWERVVSMRYDGRDGRGHGRGRGRDMEMESTTSPHTNAEQVRLVDVTKLHHHWRIVMDLDDCIALRRD